MDQKVLNEVQTHPGDDIAKLIPEEMPPLYEIFSLLDQFKNNFLTKEDLEPLYSICMKTSILDQNQVHEANVNVTPRQEDRTDVKLIVKALVKKNVVFLWY